MLLLIICFFFKQKTAYEMRISDWSSDVCSSDLRQLSEQPPGGSRARQPLLAGAGADEARQAAGGLQGLWRADRRLWREDERDPQGSGGEGACRGQVRRLTRPSVPYRSSRPRTPRPEGAGLPQWVSRRKDSGTGTEGV